MSDRELLEDAAKAAGLTVHAKHQTSRDACGAGDVGLWISNESPCWNPITDDGDALRLMVKLRMCVGIIPSNIKDGYATVTLAPANPVEIGETHNADPLAATRRAIVRAAAEIGRSMK